MMFLFKGIIMRIQEMNVYNKTDLKKKKKNNCIEVREIEINPRSFP